MVILGDNRWTKGPAKRVHPSLFNSYAGSQPVPHGYSTIARMSFSRRITYFSPEISISVPEYFP